MTIPTDLHNFVLIGQSNMVGRATLPDTQTSYYNSIYVYGNDGAWKENTNTHEPVDNAANQIDQVSADVNAEYGCSLKFAKRLVWSKGTNYHVGLIPCAKGGSSMVAWQPKCPRDDRNTLYGSMMARIDEAQLNGNLTGAVIIQGESDTGTWKNWLLWRGGFVNLVDALRADMGFALPVVFAKLGTAPEGKPYWNNLRADMLTVSAMTDVMMVSTDDLERDEYLHYSQAGYDTLGIRLADAMMEMI